MKITTKTRTVKNRKPNSRVWAQRPFFSSPSVVFGAPPAKKQKKKPEAQVVGLEAHDEGQVQRRCSHCQVQKTPQWRTGPMGAKTLCNACGVRYKSGRLFSEYRPACSPTFSSEIHSNSHRKVLEMRKRKGMVGPEPGLTAQTQMVTTCWVIRLGDTPPTRFEPGYFFCKIFSGCNCSASQLARRQQQQQVTDIIRKDFIVCIQFSYLSSFQLINLILLEIPLSRRRLLSYVELWFFT